MSNYVHLTVSVIESLLIQYQWLVVCRYGPLHISTDGLYGPCGVCKVYLSQLCSTISAASRIHMNRPVVLALAWSSVGRLRFDWWLMFYSFFQECPTGIVNEETFKEIYAQFFPHGGKEGCWRQSTFPRMILDFQFTCSFFTLNYLYCTLTFLILRPRLSVQSSRVWRDLSISPCHCPIPPCSPRFWSFFWLSFLNPFQPGSCSMAFPCHLHFCNCSDVFGFLSSFLTFPSFSFP